MSEVIAYEDRLINGRKLEFCPDIAQTGLDNLIRECNACKLLLATCCFHRSEACHNCRIVMTDGACSNNGQKDARSGLGIVLGFSEERWWSIPVDDEIDGNAPRTSQRAELLAAIEGLKKLQETVAYQSLEGSSSRNHGPSELRGHPREDPCRFAVATDSEYVVKGMTEWLPAWRKNGWRNAQGKKPANLDLFLKLDEVVASVEATGILVGFWKIPRKFNALTDALAKDATRISRGL